MKEFRIFFSIVFFILFVMCFTYHSRLMPLLLLMAFIICTSSFVLVVIARFCFSVEMIGRLPGKVIRNDEVNFSIRIKNNFILPLTPVRVYVKVCDKGIYLPKKKMIIVSVPPLREVTINIQNVMSFRGEYQIGLEKAEIFDILKIYKFSAKNNDLSTIISYPREPALSNLRDDNQFESEGLRTKPHDFNKDVFSHLREYREGESLQHIHWKLSAKQLEGDLIVKQMESTHDHSALIFCDFTCSFPKIEQTLGASDIAIETAQAIILQIILSGNSALFLFQDADSHKNQGITEMHSYKQLKRKLALLPASPPESSFIELFDEYYEEIRLERSVYIITPAVTDELVEKLRATRLLSKRNTVLVIIETDSVPSVLNQRGLIEYLKNQTPITVCQIVNEDSLCGENNLFEVQF